MRFFFPRRPDFLGCRSGESFMDHSMLRIPMSLRLPRGGSDAASSSTHGFMVEEEWVDANSHWQSSHYHASTFFEALEICDATSEHRRIKALHLVYSVKPSGVHELSRVLSVKSLGPHGLLCRLEGGLEFVTKLHGERTPTRPTYEVSLVGKPIGLAILDVLEGFDSHGSCDDHRSCLGLAISQRR
jgi:hypothetical protein